MRPAHATGLAWLLLGPAACARGEQRFPLREPLWVDTDLRPVSVKCHPQPSAKEPGHVSCAPTPAYNPILWDGFDNMAMRPLTETLGLVGVAGGESVDVNSLDEVPSSAWFTNRIGVQPMSEREIELGFCSPGQLLDGPSAGDGSWIIDKGKEEGSTDGFRVSVPGKGKYLFKADDSDTSEHSSAAQTVGSKVYFAAGYYTTCEQVVYFRRSALKLTPGLHWRHNFDEATRFDEAALERVLAHCPKRNGLVRMQASAWLPGYNLGGYRYEGTRPDDPNDVILHEDRRELRGKRLVNAWLDRFDDRRGNTLDTWVAERHGAPDASPGHVVHNQLDTSETLGSTWNWDAISRRLGYSYVLDWGDLGIDAVMLGGRISTWDTVQKRPGKELFAYFNVDDFVPDRWKNEYPVTAFSRMTERDGAWMARILAHFTPEMVAAIARTAEFTNPEDTAYLTEVLEGRLRKILQRYLTRLSPIADVRVEGTSTLCGTDLAEWRGVRGFGAFRYSARLLGGAWLMGERRAGAQICIRLPHAAPDGRLADDAPARYVRVRIEDGVSTGPLVAHLYDLGPGRGYRLAGLERPEK